MLCWTAPSFLMQSSNIVLFLTDNQGVCMCIYVGQYMCIPLFKKCTLSLPYLLHIEDLNFSVI